MRGNEIYARTVIVAIAHVMYDRPTAIIGDHNKVGNRFRLIVDRNSQTRVRSTQLLAHLLQHLPIWY